MSSAAKAGRLRLEGDLSRLPCPSCGNCTLWVTYKVAKDGKPFDYALICSGRSTCTFRLPIRK